MSGARIAMRIPAKNSMPNIPSTNSAPSRPSSSPMIGEDEVGVRVGQVVPLLTARAQPDPIHPPEPSAINPWISWNPLPWGSFQGSRNASTKRARR